MILDGNNTAGDDDDDGEAGAGKMKVEHSTENTGDTGDTDTAGALLHTRNTPGEEGRRFLDTLS